MIIDERNLDEKSLYNNPIYLLTGDFETAKFFSCLASACCKFGYFVEKAIKEHFKYTYINQTEIGLKNTGKFLLHKPKFGAEVPDYVLIDEDEKIIYVYELKINLRNMDSKKAHGEKAKYQRLKLYLEEIHPKYETKIFVVNFLGASGRNVGLYKGLDYLKIISGEQFCQMMDVSFSLVMNKIYSSRSENQQFLLDYKQKKLEEVKELQIQQQNTLVQFYESV